MTTPFDQPPAWVADAVFYQIFPDRFASSDRLTKPRNLEPWDEYPTFHGYKGGDLYGVLEHLDWITDLGVNAIYFNPIFQSASNHRYHTHDFYKVDPLLGGDEAFNELLRACHSRGIRVILDGVFNHASRGFFQFNDLLESGSDSPWIDWWHVDRFPLQAYNHEEPAAYGAWWGLHALPKFNTENPEVREYLMQVGEHWMEKGIDGWRLDVPEEIQTEGFWQEFRHRVRAINPDAYIVSEIWGDASGWMGDRFDGAMNYLLTGHIFRYVGGHRVVDEVVEGITYEVRPPQDAGGFADGIDHLYNLYGAEGLKGHLNLLGSHDTPRAMSVLGGDSQSMILSTFLMFMFPGAPCVYYGDEIGMEGLRDPDCRRAFPWAHEQSSDRDVLEATRSLIALRKSWEPLRHGEYRRLWPLPGDYQVGLYVFERRTEHERVVVAVNSSDSAESAEVPGIDGSDFHTLWGSGGISDDGETTGIALKERSAAVWRVG
ncbi:MAG: glycoside hydrolase family 13 protein [Acidimicrobiia bacterium]|nr:glycoside hydrolase family 13 protein [Acidimicrobiia bacterium]